jgi:uncharacterized protein YeaO (DUF488 family)
MLRIKRVYDKPEKQDGTRVLVDRIWPRGLSKEEANLDEWMKELAPSSSLRQWYGHQEERWDEFRNEYAKELKQEEKKEKLRQLADWAEHGNVTLLFGAKDLEHNQAVAIARYLKQYYHCPVEPD